MKAKAGWSRRLFPCAFCTLLEASTHPLCCNPCYSSPGREAVLEQGSV